MKQMKLRLSLAASAAALLAACVSGGGAIGPLAAGGCQTVFVFNPAGGGVQPVSNCGAGGAVPRERLMTEAKVQSLAPTLEPQTAAANGKTSLVATRISPAAEATRPPYAPAKPYAGPNDMLENADMAAFMAKVRADYAAGKNSGAWGYVAVDAIAAGDANMAEDVLDAMAAKPDPEMLSATHLRPWVLAAAGRKDRATAAVLPLRTVMPPFMVRGHRALLAEGMGDLDLALAAYAEGPKVFNAPDKSKAGTPDYLMRALTYASDRLLALRQAELMRTAGKDADAKAVFQALLVADPDDAYVQGRLKNANLGKDKRPVRTLKQAFALAINDEADLVEQRQSIMGMMVGRGQKAPFNYLLSSLHQIELLLDPDNGEIRIGEVEQLYQHGQFEAALRLAQAGNPSPATRSALYSQAAQAALQLGSPDAMGKLVDQALKYDNTAGARITAANTLADADLTEKSLKLLDETLKDKSLEQRERIAALLTRAQTHLQAGDVNGAVADARSAVAVQDGDDTQGFLASMLVKSTPQARQEGLAIMRKMIMTAPGDTSQMNNFGYSLIDGHAGDAELDEGFKLLKEAARLTPDEPNLLDSLAWAYYQYGDFREARHYEQLALKAYEPFAHWELHDHMGDIEWRSGDKEAAKKEWQESIKARPPAHEKADVAAKIVNGLTAPAPKKRDTPEVPLPKQGRESNDI
jgi:tetratricopeptide (TPR) repeat protein